MNRRIYGFLFPLLSPEGAPGGGGSGADDMSESARDLADLEEGPGDGGKGSGDDDGEGDGDDDSEGEGEGDEEEGDEGEGEDDEGEEGDEDEEEEGDGKKGKKKDDEEEEPETDAQGRPTVKAIKALAPDLFKKFPYLKTAFFELPKYKEVFSTPEEAQGAAAKAADFDALEVSLVGKGDAHLLLDQMNTNNPKALAKMLDGFGDAVRKVDPNLYLRITEPIIEELLHFAAKHADKIGDKNLKLSAQHLARYVFNNGGEIPQLRQPKSNEPSDEEKELQRDRQNFDNERFGAAMEDVATRSVESIDKIFERKLDMLTPFEKKAVLRDAREELNTTLKADKELQRKLSSLWASAKRDSYSTASKERVKEAWLSRAKLLAPGIRNRLKQEALAARTPGKGTQQREGGKRTFPVQGGGGSRGSSRVLDPTKIDWKKTSDADILNDNGKVTLKR